MLDPRDIWSTAPPEPRSRDENWPTLLYSWWCTAFATAIILIRLNGRKVRSGQLFREDWIMIWAMVPLWARMVLVHFILIYGTNNVDTVNFNYSDQQLANHSTGAKLVLASRILYAAFIWMSKWTVSEFLKRMTITLWRRSYEMTLQGIRGFLIFTFIAVVIATLAECQPFSHYWQVTPDPGPQCRQGFSQLLTMGIADIITDILLIAFPIPIVLKSGQPWTRKVLLTALFSTSTILIIITGFRMPEVIGAQGRQQYRTVWASSEIIASTFVANSIIIGSFLRDKGPKRNKYKPISVTDSMDRSSTRRPTIVAINDNDSDEDLFRSLGCRVPEHLQDPKPDPKAAPLMSSPYSERTEVEAAEDDDENHDSLRKHPALPSPAPSTVSKRNMSFFDVGGLLEDGHDHFPETPSQTSTAVEGSTAAYDFAPPSPTSTRRGSQALLMDLGAFLGRSDADTRRVHASAFRPLAARYRATGPSLQDAGGLLSTPPEPETPRQARRQQQGLQDVGGLLDSRHTMDASAMALQRRLQQTPQTASLPTSVPSSSSTAVSHGYESMDLQDPGGLLR
ncbi:hypothetical protein AMS68_003227 [Peltaster fructicola]|uniref:Rhodopsin domain-containing protein n=1 Tax=Peltaster fructicola TaxID=286661 RepID=A0A6H0XTC7_9PEZI|nr:hypothetical protein AMS68_003227 [Peltaster fructicola]